MKGVRRFQDYLKEQLQDPAFREAYEEEGVYAELALRPRQRGQGPVRAGSRLRRRRR